MPDYSEAMRDHIIGFVVRVYPNAMDYFNFFESAYFSAYQYFALRSLWSFFASSETYREWRSKGLIDEAILSNLCWLDSGSSKTY